MRLLFFLIPALLLAPIMIYLYFYAKRTLHFWGAPTEKRWLRLLLMAACLLLGILSSNLWSSMVMIILHLFLSGVLVDLVYWLLRRLGFKKEKIYRSGLLPVILTLAVLGFGYWNMGHVVEKPYTIYTEKPIREEGYRIAFLSDLHFGLSMDTEKLAAYAQKIAEAKPDMVLLGGDIVDESTTQEEMQQAFQILGAIPSTYGTFYVYGNHDRALYSADPYFTAQQLQQAMAGAGIRVLSDEAVSLNEEFTLVGREEVSYAAHGSGVRAQSAKLLEAVDPSDFILLLDHQPRELEANQEAGVDLQLSGHTHAGQIWPAGWLSDLFHFNEMTYGQRQTEGFQIIVSSGMAGWGYPIRTSGRSEYVMISLQKKG